MIHYMSNNMLKVLYMAMVGLRVGGEPTETIHTTTQRHIK